MGDKLFQLNWNDLLKGLIMAVLGAVIGLVSASVDAGSIDFNWSAIGKAALIAGIGYLCKNLLTNSNDQFMKKEPVKDDTQK